MNLDRLSDMLLSHLSMVLIVISIGLIVLAILLLIFCPRIRAYEKEHAGYRPTREPVDLEKEYAGHLAYGAAVIIKGDHKSWIPSLLPTVIFIITTLALWIYADFGFEDCTQLWGVSWRLIALLLTVGLYCSSVWITIRGKRKEYEQDIEDGYTPARWRKFRQDTISFKMTPKLQAKLKRAVRFIYIWMIIGPLSIIPHFLQHPYGFYNHYESLSDMNRKVQAICMAHRQIAKESKSAS